MDFMERVKAKLNETGSQAELKKLNQTTTVLRAMLFLGAALLTYALFGFEVMCGSMGAFLIISALAGMTAISRQRNELNARERERKEREEKIKTAAYGVSAGHPHRPV